MTVEGRELRNCLGRFTTGVTVVTCHGREGTAHGMTVNAFTSVSLDPPLVLVSIDRRTQGHQLLQSAPFTINILHEGQRDVALHFAGRPQANLDLTWEEGKLAPRLLGCLAHVECEPWQAYDGGDHVLFLGRVHALDYQQGEPLLFYTGRFHALGETFDLPWLESLDCPTAGWLGQLPGDARRPGSTQRTAAASATSPSSSANGRRETATHRHPTRPPPQRKDVR